MRMPGRSRAARPVVQCGRPGRGLAAPIPTPGLWIWCNGQSTCSCQVLWPTLPGGARCAGLKGVFWGLRYTPFKCAPAAAGHRPVAPQARCGRRRDTDCHEPATWDFCRLRAPGYQCPRPVLAPPAAGDELAAPRLELRGCAGEDPVHRALWPGARPVRGATVGGNEATWLGAWRGRAHVRVTRPMR